MTGELSQRDRIAALPEAKRKAFADSLSQGEAEELLNYSTTGAGS